MKKVCVYAICKNEIDFVDKWLDSMSEADYIVVLDTGSTDGTYQKLKNDNRVTRVECESINPWRFDEARNRSMRLIPNDADILCCIDLDERFDPGWADQLRANWTDEVWRAVYPFVTDQDAEGNILGSYLACKIHSKGFHWKYPVHEILERNNGNEVFGVYNRNDPRYLFLDNLILRHYQDVSKSRNQYIDLLYKRFDENDKDIFAIWYLGKEYEKLGDYETQLAFYRFAVDDCGDSNMYCGMSIVSPYMVGDVLRKLGRDKEAMSYYSLAIIQDGGYLREPYLRMAELMNDLGHYKVAISFVNECLEKLKEDRYYWNRQNSSWAERPYDIAGVSYYRLGDIEMAAEMFKTAFLFAPDDERIRNNYACVMKELGHE